MMKMTFKTGLRTSSMLLSAAGVIVAFSPQRALAQEQTDTPATAAPNSGEQSPDKQDIVVTGSRIRRSDTTTSAPVTVVGEKDILERGYTQVGDALNKVTSITPQFPGTPGDSTPTGSGQQYPNLFALGAGRTLTLVNGRRATSSAQGQGDRVVDTNTIPVGLLQRVEVVQAGGAAVYGSDAIAGVVNYVLKTDFDGLTIDLQNGISSRGDYPQPSARLTAGKNFAGGRGNIAMNVEYSKTSPLLFGSRPITDPVVRSLSNPLNTSLTDGIPARTPVVDPHYWYTNRNGVLFANDDPFRIANLLGYSVTGAQSNGYQFSPDGQSVIRYNAGNQYVPGYNCRFPFCSGGEGVPYSDLAALYSGIQRISGTALGHYDLTDHLKLSGEFSYTRTRGSDPRGTQVSDRLIEIDNTNPFLTPSAIASLSALQPGFADGDPVYLDKYVPDLFPDREFRYTTDTYRGVMALDGDFNVGSRNFYYSAFFSRGVVKGRTKILGSNYDRGTNAYNARLNSSGQIVCAINADDDPTNDDAACIPINPFGINKASQAAIAYTLFDAGESYKNTQDDYLASIGGDIVKLPGGPLKFSLSYEHRAEKSKFTPSIARQRGDGGYVDLPTSGRFHTNEYAGELLVPLVGDTFTLPLVKRLEVTGQYRRVDNSLAGKENVWGAGGRWEIGAGLTLRASRSRNFRAPTLNQLLAPSSTTLDGGIADPCDARAINSGPAPATRLKNCQALFAANPSYGPLDGYEQVAFNSSTSTLITSGGNPNLRNEVSNTTTFGFIWQPKFVPGSLTLIADRVVIDLKDGLTPFDPTAFAEACFDASPQPADVCSTFTRDSAGTIVTATNTVFNAAAVRYRGEVYQLNYRFPLSWFLKGDPGSIEFNVEATRNEKLDTIVSNVTTSQAGTIVSPDWVVRGQVNYNRGPLGISYELYYLPKSKQNSFDTIESTPFPVIGANARHSVSASYDVSKLFHLRAGVNNLTDKGPSFPTFGYGDIVGRQFFVGARITY